MRAMIRARRLAASACASNAFGFDSGNVSHSLNVDGVSGLRGIAIANSTLEITEASTLALFWLPIIELPRVQRRALPYIDR